SIEDPENCLLALSVLTCLRQSATDLQDDTANGSLQLDHRVWRRRREPYADCCTNRLTSFGGGSVMVWGCISLTGKIRIVIIRGNINAERSR
uniref:Uncharacterized protein n=1 Tax=Echeneis naucrates TaxID=173247 RepID=A0A665V3R4_ECHNA